MYAEMAQFPQVTTYWVEPFDDPHAEFTPLYKNLVEELKEMVSKQETACSFGPFTSFEADHYHLSSDDRQKFAKQILEWFAGKGIGNLTLGGPA